MVDKFFKERKIFSNVTMYTVGFVSIMTGLDRNEIKRIAKENGFLMRNDFISLEGYKTIIKALPYIADLYNYQK